MTCYVAVSYKLYGSHGCGRHHVVYMHAIETCGTLCIVMVTFADHLT